MKRKLQVLAMLISATVSSQSFGLKAGANVSTISKEKSWDDTNAKLAIT